MEGIRVLVIDDEEAQRGLIAGFFKKQGLEVAAAEGGSQGLERLQKEPFDLVLVDYRMPGISGLEVLREVKRVNPEIPVIVMTAYGTIETAVQAMKEGAYDYLTKPVDLDDLWHRIERARERQWLLAENRELKERLQERYHFDQIIGESGKMQEVLALVHRVSNSGATVLIRGESGTGKELIAKAIHYNSPRAEGPFIKVNCAALPENLLESELFGHEKGAFTGAVSSRIGRFEAADKGTIFLDEIGDLSPSLQVKLLRVLQEREFERLGSNRTIKVDVRIIAATNRDLEAVVRGGRFREDLYYRLNVVPISIPPLRERREDLPPLMDHFLTKLSLENRKTITGLTREARDALMRYEYPGNVRELENILERAVVLARSETIGLSDLPISLQEPKAGEETEKSLPSLLEGIERRMIVEALQKSQGVQTKAAELLGISERMLRYKLKKYGI
ncbi:MAG: sigma-54-dependent Fis family transcriptional regulator [candidate division NC10 bacterium]|nr:sigma-54-dependent Fis family transcriptional regulator [candidate division NC10 bacterium]